MRFPCPPEDVRRHEVVEKAMRPFLYDAAAPDPSVSHASNPASALIHEPLLGHPLGDGKCHRHICGSHALRQGDNL